MKSKKYILLIMNCEKYRYKAVKQKNMWLCNFNNENIVYFHVIGSNEKCHSKEYIFDNENNILYVNTKDDYCSLPSKVINAFYAVNKEYNYDYIFKTDDDQNLIVHTFFNQIIQNIELKQNINYGGKLINVNNHYSNYFTVHNELPKELFLKKTTYCTGRFYLLSKNCVNELLINKKKISKCIIEDHTIGLYLPNNLKKNGLYFNSDIFFKDM